MDRLRIGPVSPLDEKKEAIAAKSDEKKTRLDPAAALDNAYLRATQDRRARNLAENAAAVDGGLAIYEDANARLRENQGRILRRTPIEMMDDTLKAAQAGSVDFATGIGALGLELGAKTFDALDATNIGKRMSGKEQQVMETGLAKALRMGAGNLVQSGSKVSAGIRDDQTLQVKVAREDVSTALRGDSAEAQREYEASLAQGDSQLLSEAARFGKGVLSGAQRSIENPTFFADAIAGQVPSLAAGLLGRAAVSAKAVQARAAQMAAAEGVAVTPAMLAAAKVELGTGTMMASTGAMEAGGAYQQVSAEINGMTMAELRERFPEARDSVMDEASLKRDLISKIGVNAAAQQGVLAAGISRIASGFEIDPLNVAGRRVLGDMAKEGLEEGLQSASGEAAVNTAMILEGDTQTSLLDGVGQAAGQGAVLGAGMAGALPLAGQTARAVLTAPLAAASVVGPVLRATGRAVATVGNAAVAGAGKLAEGRANKVRSGVNAEAHAQTAQARNESITELRTDLEQAGVQVDLTSAAAKLSPEAVQELADTSVQDLDQLGVYSAIVSEMTDPSVEFDFSPGNGKLAYVVNAQDGIRRLARQTQAQLETEEDPVKREALVRVNQRAQSLLDNEALQILDVIKDEVPKLTEEALKTFTAKATEVGYTELDVETQNAADTLRSLILSGRTQGISAEVIGQTKVLFSENLDETERQIMETSEAVAVERERYEEEVSKKGFGEVRADLETDGFLLGRKVLNSVQHYVEEVTGMVSAGYKMSSRNSLGEMFKWAEHTTKRITEFDALAQEQLAEFEATGKWGDAKKMSFAQLAEDQVSLDGKKSQFVNLAFDGGRELGRVLEEDARTIVRTYNELAALAGGPRLPEIAPTQWKTKLESLGAKADSPVGKQQPSTPAATPVPAATTEVPTAAVVEPVPPPAPPPQAAAVVVEAVKPAVKEEAAEAQVVPVVADDTPTPKTTKPAKRKVPKKPMSLLGVIAGFGGLNRAAFEKEGVDKAAFNQQVGISYIFRKNGGMTPDRLREFMQQEGYLPRDPEDAPPTVSDNDAVELLFKALAGNDVFSEDQSEALADYLDAKRQEDAEYEAELKATSAALPVEGEESLVPAEVTMEERFPGLEGSRVGEGPRARNRFMSAFKLRANSNSLFARVSSPLLAIREALKTGEAAVRELFNPGAEFARPLTETEVRGLRQMFGRYSDVLLQRLNENLDKTFQSRKKSIDNETSGLWTWNFADLQAMHLGERYVDDQGVERMRFQAHIAEAIVAGGMRWVIDTINRPHQFREDDVQKLYPDRVIPPEFYEAHVHDKTYAGESDLLAKSILRTMGLSTNLDESKTSTEGLPLTMAASFMEVLTSLTVQVDGKTVSLVGVERLTPEMAFKDEETYLESVKGTNKDYQKALDTLRSRRARMGDKITTFLRFPSVDEPGALLAQLSLALDDSTEVLDALFDGNADAQAQIGKPVIKVNTRVKGVNVQAGDGQTQTLKTLGKTPQWMNVGLAQLVSRIPEELQRQLFGEIPYTEDGTSKADHPRLLGLMKSAYRTRRELQKLQGRVRQYAEAESKDPGEVPLYWGYRMNSNGRAEQQGFGGQNNKWARELFVGAMVEIDLSNVEHMRDYWLSLAQAFDIKVENVTNETAIAEIKTRLADSTKLQPLLAMFQAIETGDTELDNATALVDAVLKAGFGNTARAFNALQGHVQFLALGPDAKIFKHGLVFEVDGKTDGPVNALVQFGLTHLGPHLLRQLSQGGLFVGKTESGTLNENHDAKSPDLYSNPIMSWSLKMRAFLENKQVHPEVREIFRNSMKGLYRTKRLKKGEDDQGRELLVALRNLFKNPFTQKTYGAGDRAIVIATAKDVASKYGQLISQAFIDKKPLPATTVAEIQMAFGQTVVYSKKRDSYFNFGVAVMPLDSLEDYKNFQIFQSNIDALASQYIQGAGALMAEEINIETESVNHNLANLYKITALQAAAFSMRYRKAYNARRLELVREGVLSPQDALSQNEETKLLEQFRSLEPVFHTSQTKGGHGVTLIKGVDSDALPVLGDYVDSDGVERKARTGRDDRNTVLVQGAGKGFSTDIPVTFPAADVGVRFAALMNIAAGDAAMMGQVFQDVVRQWFNVFDGLEVPTGQLNDASRTVNEAVWNNWMFDLLGSIEEQYTQFDFDFKEMGDAELADLLKAYRLPSEEFALIVSNPEIPTREELVTYFNGQKKLLLGRLQRAREITNMVKQVMGELGSSTDHMAGPMAPHIRAGRTFPNQGEVLAYLQEEVSKRLGYTPENFIHQAEREAIEDQTGKPFEAPVITVGGAVEIDPAPKADEPMTVGATILSGEALRKLLDKHKFTDKVGAFVYSKIRSLIPRDLKVVYGSPEDLAMEAANLFPDLQMDTTKQGAYYKGVIFIRKKDGARSLPAGVILHELVHATTYGMIADYYTNGGRQLTRGQKDAARDLEKLAHFVIDMRVDGVRGFKGMQQILRTLRDAGRTGDMVEELMAYSLTSPAISHYLQTQKGPVGIRAIGKRLLNALRGFLGLPENLAVDSFLGQTIDQVTRLVTRPVADVPPAQGMLALYSALGDEDADSSYEHTQRVEELLGGMDELLALLPDDVEVALRQRLEPDQPMYDREGARLVGLRAVARMEEAGFDLTQREKLAFSGVHAVITAMSSLDPLAISELQDLHQQAMKKLKLEDMIDEGMGLTSSDAIELAQKRLEALRYVGGLDVYGRSPLLANFVALASVHEPLRLKLAGMRMESQKIERDNFDTFLRTAARKLFDVLGGKALKTFNKPQQQVLDEMLNRIMHAKKQAQAVKSSGRWAVVDPLEDAIKSQMYRAYRGLDGLATKLENERGAGDTSLKNSAALLSTDLVSALLAPESEGDKLAERFTRILNTTKVGGFVRGIGNELIGTNAGNRNIHRLLNQAKMHISQIRQRLRDQVPRIVEGLFTAPLEKKQLKLLYRTLGRTDAQALLDSVSMTEAMEMLRDPAKLEQAVQALLQTLPPAAAVHLNEKAQALGQYLSTRSTQNGDQLMVRNATALLVRTEKEMAITLGVNPEERAQMILDLDRLITFRAWQALNESERQQTADILEQDPDGVEKTLRMLRNLRDIELSKAPDNGYRLNTWKGHLPSTLDPRKDLVLASVRYGAELEKRGYHRVGYYNPDETEGGSAGLAYYASKWSGGLSAYNQGALQTVENSLMGIDTLTGQTLDPAARMLISNPDEVAAISDTKLARMRRNRSPKGRGAQLLPIFNDTGEIIAYERPVDAGLLAQYTRQEGHLAEAIGMWLGRQTEEALASNLNDEVINTLHEGWMKDKSNGRADEYDRVDAGPRSAVTKDTWDTLPRHVQEQLSSKFGDDGVMVRKDLKDNALGYRATSVTDIFTGTSNLPPDMRKALENVAFALAGKRAYPLLVTGERAWQGLIGTAKDIVVVRSGIVAVANLLANQIQLLQMTGWNPARLLRVQLAKAKELEHYLRNQSRITELTVQIATTVDGEQLVRMKNELRGLVDSNTRLSIMPLLSAGMLPTIAEGLTEQDQYTLLHDGMRWVEERVEKLPSGILTAAKYAVVAKDTALYQGLNRMVQFGDFMAKAALYEAMMERTGAKKQSEDESAILDEVNESFVNYNLLPGRGRDYLESMGITWFWNYKLRVQKIALRSLKRNPLRFLTMGVGAEVVGSDSLLSTSAPAINWGYSVGPDQLWRSHQMLLWRTLMQ